MSEICVFSPLGQFFDIFGHFSTFFGHFVNIPFSGLSNELPVIILNKHARAEVGDSVFPAPSQGRGEVCLLRQAEEAHSRTGDIHI